MTMTPTQPSSTRVDPTPADQAPVDAYPMAALQAGMIFHSSLDEGARTYHDVLTLILAGSLDPAALEAALNDVVAAHPVLRTGFDLTTFSQPMQLVYPAAPVRLAIDDLSPLEPDQARQFLRTWSAQEQRRGFDWSRPPLLRAHLHRLPADRFALTLGFHHAILDGWSVATMVTEVLRRYAARLGGHPLPAAAPDTAYRDFVRRERETVDSPAARAFWQDTLAGAPLTRLPRDPTRAAGEAGGGTDSRLVDEVVPDEIAAGLAELAHRLRVPIRAVLLAAHIRVLALAGGNLDVLTGLLANGRPESEDAGSVLGLFVNVVPLRLDLRRESWARLIHRVVAAEAAALPHRGFPLFELQRLTGRNPLVEVVFDYRDFHAYDGLPAGGPVRLVDRHHRETTDMPLGVSFVRARKDGGRLHRYLTYAPEAYTAEQVTALHRLYAAALRDLVAGEHRPAHHTAPYLGGGAARSQGPRVELGAHASLPELVAGQARQRPDAVAVVDQAGALSYAALMAAARELAGRLRAAGVARGTHVGVHLPRSTDFAVAVLGTMLAGAAVVPLEVDYPRDRLLHALRDSGATALVTRTDHAGTLPYGGPVVLVDRPGAGIAPDPVDPRQIAYVLYTSGSTGSPKGVALSHAALANYFLWSARSLGMRPGDRIAQRSPAGFDGCLYELMVALLAGGTAVITSQDTVLDPDRFAAFLARHRVGTVVLVPSLLALHVDAGTFARPGSPHTVICAGEALPQGLVDRLAAQSGARVVNLYGPTEGGIGATERQAGPGAPGATVPIGHPIGNVSVAVLDEHGQVQPVGLPGELYLGGDQLAAGYVGAPALTASRFVPDHLSGLPGARLYRTGDAVRMLPGGELEFLGRLDGQVKINGVRVEPAEIEAMLQEHPDVAQAAVTVLPGSGGTPVLAAYVVPRGEAEPRPAQLRAYLRGRLHPAMVPNQLVRLAAIPTLPNGKLDRAALPAPAGDQRPAGARDHLEADLLDLWSELLGRPVGIHDDFFDLGGHSLLALRLGLLIRDRLGRTVPTSAILAAPTVAQLAVTLRTPADAAPPAPVVKLAGERGRPGLFFMHGLGGDVFRYRPIARRLGGNRPVYALAARGLAGTEQPHRSMAALAADHADRIRQVQPDGPYLVGGFCIGGNIALEVARTLRAGGARVPLVAMFWSSANQPVLRDSLTDDTTLLVRALAGGQTGLDLARLRDRPATEQLLAVLGAASERGTLRTTSTDLDQAQRLLAVYRANAHAVGWHRMEPYDGDVLLLVPADDPALAGFGLAGWDEVVTGRLEVVAIPGTRSTSVRPPLVAEVAALLERRLAAAHAQR
jgi:amino acid adenylation domain-containing protein